MSKKKGRKAGNKPLLMFALGGLAVYILTRKKAPTIPPLLPPGSGTVFTPSGNANYDTSIGWPPWEKRPRLPQYG